MCHTLIVIKLPPNKITKLLLKIKPHVTLTNILLFLILITIIKGFYISSREFRFFIDNLGYSSRSEHIGSATFSCTYGKLSKDEYEEKIDELNKQIVREESEGKLLNIDLIHLKTEKDMLQREGYLTTKTESVEVIKTRDYRFGIRTNVRFEYAKEEPKNDLYRKCKCEGIVKNGICEWKPLEKPSPY